MDSTCAVRFTRRYDATPDEVWAALTEPESIARWLAPPGRIELAPGGPFELRPREGETLPSRVRAIDARRLLELDWVDESDAASTVRFELAPDGDGKRAQLRLGFRRP